MPTILKAQFQKVDPATGTLYDAPVVVSFNPTEFTLNKANQIAEVTIPGLDSPVLQFVCGQTEGLSLNLFFDSTDSGMDENAKSVTQYTDPFYQLIKIDGDLHAPPVLFFSWGQQFPGNRPYAGMGQGHGSQQRYGFKCVVESVRQRFTLFSPSGIPLRATLTVALKEYKTLAEQVQQINHTSADKTHAHVVQQGESLAQIAAGIYGDATQWRAIATENAIADPLVLTPGRVLQIPTLVNG